MVDITLWTYIMVDIRLWTLDHGGHYVQGDCVLTIYGKQFGCTPMKLLQCVCVPVHVLVCTMLSPLPLPDFLPPFLLHLHNVRNCDTCLEL